MAQNTSAARARQALLLLGCVFLVVAVLYGGRAVLIPLAAALLLSFVLTPPVAALERRRLPRVAAVPVVVLAAALLLAGVGWVITAQLGDLLADLPNHQQNIIRKAEGLQTFGRDVGGRLTAFLEGVASPPGTAFRAPGEAPRPVPVTPVGGGSLNLSWLTAVNTVFGAFAQVALVVALVFLILLRREDLRNRLIRLTSGGRLALTTRALDEAGQRISSYLVMLLLINGSYGIVTAMGLFVVGVPQAFLWGVLAAILRFVPYVGPWVAAVLPLGVSVATSPGWAQPVLVLAVFLVNELFSNNVMEPWLYGRSVGASAVALILAATFWTLLWGPLGLILSTPLTTCLVVLGKYVPALEFLSVLLSNEPALEPEASFYQRLLAHDRDEAGELLEDLATREGLDAGYDQALVPALVQADRDRARGLLDAEEHEAILRGVRDLAAVILEPHQQIRRIIAHGPGGPAAAGDGPGCRILGCPAQSQADETALFLLGQNLASAHCVLETVSVTLLAGELLGRVARARPAAVCVADLPPGGIAAARYLCKRLRAQFPEVPIVVWHWSGGGKESEQARERFREAGATAVAATLAEARARLQAYGQTAAFGTASAS